MLTSREKMNNLFRNFPKVTPTLQKVKHRLCSGYKDYLNNDILY